MDKESQVSPRLGPLYSPSRIVLQTLFFTYGMYNYREGSTVTVVLKNVLLYNTMDGKQMWKYRNQKKQSQDPLHSYLDSDIDSWYTQSRLVERAFFKRRNILRPYTDVLEGPSSCVWVPDRRDTTCGDPWTRA